MGKFILIVLLNILKVKKLKYLTNHEFFCCSTGWFIG